MNTSTNNTLSDSYFRFLKSLNTAAKKQLIIKLTESIDEPTGESSDFSACFGAWNDDRSAQQIYEDIRKDRVNNTTMEDL